MSSILGRLNEGCSAVYTATLKDEAGAAVAGSVLSTLELWLYDWLTKTVINVRGVINGAGQNVLNANNVTIDESGKLTWALQPADNIIVTATNAVEIHEAVFRATWGGGKTCVHKVAIQIRNIAAFS